MVSTNERDSSDEEPDWYPDVTDDALRPRNTAGGIEYYVEPNGAVFLATATFPDERSG